MSGKGFFGSLKDKITNIQTERKFKKAGEGRRLNDDASGPSPSHRPPQAQPQRAVSADPEREKRLQAALSRKPAEPQPSQSASRKAIQMAAARQLAAESEDSFRGTGQSMAPERQEPTEYEHSGAIEQVLFTCERFCPDIALPKSEMIQTVEEQLIKLFTEDFDTAVSAAVILLYSRNRSKKDELERAVQTLRKIVTTICENPTEPKFRKINKNSVAFKDKINNVRFAREFLDAVGFVEKQFEDTPDTVHLVFEGQESEDLEKLSIALAILASHTEEDDVRLKLHRNAAVFKIDPNQKIEHPELDADFFKLTVDEAKKLQADRANEVEKLTTLRTQEMRDREAAARKNIYKYTLVRVRFPNNYLLQGTFGAFEALRNVRSFIHERLNIEFGSFLLRDPARGTILSNDDKSLQDLGLCPAVILHFDWDKDTQMEFAKNNIDPSYLNEELQSGAELFQP